MNKLNGILSTALLLLGGIVWLQHRHTIYLTEERDRFQMNNTALLSCMKRMQIDSTTMALETKVLRLTVDEYKEIGPKMLKLSGGLESKSRNSKQPQGIK